MSSLQWQKTDNLILQFWVVNGHTYIHTYRQTDRQTDRQIAPNSEDTSASMGVQQRIAAVTYCYVIYCTFFSVPFFQMYGKHTQGLIKTIKINKNKKIWHQNHFPKNLKQIRTKLISRYPNKILNVTYWSNIWMLLIEVTYESSNLTLWCLKMVF